MRTKGKGFVGMGMLVPVFLLMFALIVIFAGIEWGVNTSILMAKEKQVTQMDSEILGINDLYITPSLKFAMQEVTRNIALHGGLSSEILRNNKLFVYNSTTEPDVELLEEQIETDFNNGNLEFPTISTQMKVEGNILYWSYYRGDLNEHDNLVTVPYTYNSLSKPTELDSSSPLELNPSYIVLIRDIEGSVNHYEWDGSTYIFKGTYTEPIVLSGDVKIKLNVSVGDSARLEGGHGITSYFKPLFPEISYPYDALAQRDVFPRFTDIMLSDRLNSYRSDYGNTKTTIGSKLSLGTWNAFFVPLSPDISTTLAFYGGNRIVQDTKLINMENSDPVKSEIDNRYWELFDIAKGLTTELTEDMYLYNPITMNASYSEKYPASDLFREKIPKTCSEEWQVISGDTSYTCNGQQEDNTNLFTTFPTAFPTSLPICTGLDTSSDVSIYEITIDAHKYAFDDIINIDVKFDCTLMDPIRWRIDYDDDSFGLESKEGTFSCRGSLGHLTPLKETFKVTSSRAVQFIRVSVMRGDSLPLPDCVSNSYSDIDEISFEHFDVTVPGALAVFSANQVNDSCFDGDTKCRFQKECNDKYKVALPIIEPKKTGDVFSTLKAKNGRYTSKIIRFDINDGFNQELYTKFNDSNILPFISAPMSKEDLAANISAAEEVYLTFNYGSNTTIGCGEREDLIHNIEVYGLDPPILGVSFRPRLNSDFNPNLEGTNHNIVSKKQKIILDKNKISEQIRDQGYLDLYLAVYINETGENLPLDMYPERNSRIYIYDKLLSGAMPSSMIDINPDYINDSLEPSMNYGFENAKGIAVDKEGSIYVINNDDNKLYRYNKFGIFNGYMDLFNYGPNGLDIDIDTGNIYVGYTQNVTRYDHFFDSRELIMNPGLPSIPFSVCNTIVGPIIDVAYYKGYLFMVKDNNKLSYCSPASNTWRTFAFVLPGEKIKSISVDSINNRLYTKIYFPYIDADGNTAYKRKYDVFNLTVFSNNLPSIVSPSLISSETIPISFEVRYFDIYTPQKGEDTQAYFVRKTYPKPTTYALLDDFKLNIDFGDTFEIEAETMDNVVGLTDKIEYYNDGCGSVVTKDTCEELWVDYSLNEYYDDIYYFHDGADCTSLNEGSGGVDIAIVNKLKTLLGLAQTDDIPCDKTIDDLRNNRPNNLGATPLEGLVSAPEDFIRLKIRDKIIIPHLKYTFKELNDRYNTQGIFIDYDYDIRSDFGVGWQPIDFWAEVNSDFEEQELPLACSCLGRQNSCLAGYSGHGNASYINTFESSCEYKYGAIYSLNITIEDRKNKVWDPIVHKMTPLVFKFGLEWSTLDDKIEVNYTADERDLSPYGGLGDAYCFESTKYTPEVCHTQNNLANYNDATNDIIECPNEAGHDVTYNELHCQNDDYPICYGPSHSHSCGEGCSFTHRHQSCTRYDNPHDCEAASSNAHTDTNHYTTCTTTPGGFDAGDTEDMGTIIPCESGETAPCYQDEVSIDYTSLSFDIIADPTSIMDSLSNSFDITLLSSACVETSFNPIAPVPLNPIGIQTYSSSIIANSNKSFTGKFIVEEKDTGC